MESSQKLKKLKKKLSARLLDNDGVSGVGMPGGKLAVYLTEDSQSVRDDVAKVVEAEAPGADVDYVVIGKMRAQRGRVSE